MNILFLGCRYNLPLANDRLDQHAFLAVARVFRNELAQSGLDHSRITNVIRGGLHRYHTLSAIQPDYRFTGAPKLARGYVKDLTAIFSIEHRHTRGHLTSSCAIGSGWGSVTIIVVVAVVVRAAQRSGGHLLRGMVYREADKERIFDGSHVFSSFDS